MPNFKSEKMVFDSLEAVNVATIITFLDGQYIRDNGLFDLTMGATTGGGCIVLDEKTIWGIQGQLDNSSKKHIGRKRKILVFALVDRKYGLALGKVFSKEEIVYRGSELFVNNDGVSGELSDVEVAVAGKEKDDFYQLLSIPQNLMNGADIGYLEKTYLKYKKLLPNKDVGVFAGKRVLLSYPTIGDNVFINVSII